MQIAAIRVFTHDLEVADGIYEMSTSRFGSLTTTIVEVESSNGVVGYGETCPLGSAYQEQFAGGAIAAMAELAPAVIGLDPRHHRLVNEAMDAALYGHLYAKSAIDVACWDLAAKTAGVRVCDLLGGSHGDSVASYWGIMPGDLNSTVTRALQLVDDGYRRLQIKTGARDLADDIAATRAIAAAVPANIGLLADANRGWTARDAIEFSIACRDIPLVLEQPCATLDEHRQLVGRVPHPVFLDESATDIATVITIIADGLAQGFGMKLSRVGGLTRLQTIRDICHARGIPMTIDDTWGGDITAASCVHMATTLDPSLHEATWISQPYTAEQYPVTTDPVVASGGRIEVPKGPGLGVQPDLERFAPPVAVY
ncbi:MAG: mandelate racemase/muconate lactonizing enzyme family protein [Actinomycetia bacterium]|nr:mandelate racemase/muconate lactonizing enzyme family protein [Actinomycetes bacterium]MCP4963527.1 mandelate racemase/muconate lactonizing enzyme family protein [Actinomycetes bacterium]